MNRAAILTKTHKVLKKHYKPVAPAERPLLEQLLYACCLENSGYEAADAAYENVQKSFFDLNEVRVTTVTELAEMMQGLHEPRTAAWNLRSTLHSVFEATYSFDLEQLKKKTLGQAVAQLGKFSGVTPFAVSWATQTSLGGHSIPIDRGAMQALLILGAVNDKEAESGTTPGLERAIPKSKGVEFGSLLHQLGADLLARPFATELRDLLLSITPEAKDRLPKRAAKKKTPAASGNGKAPSKKTAKASAGKSSAKKAAKKSAAAKRPAKTAKSGKRAAAKPKPR